MKENYFGNVNYQNNIKIVEPGKTSLLSNNTITTNLSLDGSRTFADADESKGIEELPPMDEGVDHLKNFHLQNRNKLYHYNNLNSTNRYNQYTANMIHSFQPKNNNLNSNNFINAFPQRKTQVLYYANQNNFNNPFNTIRNSSGEKKRETKQVQSRYSSASENKYHFIHKLAKNPQFLIFNNTNSLSGNVARVNYAPINASKTYMNNVLNNNSNSKNYYNSIDNLYSNNSQSQFSSPNTPNQNVTNLNNIQNTRFDERENNYKRTSNYGYKTVDVRKLQNNIQTLKINDLNKTEQAQNKNLNNKIISNFDISGNNNANYYSSVNQVNNNNYMNVNRLTVVPNNNQMNNNYNIGQPRLTTYESNTQNKFLNILNNPQGKEKLNFNQALKNVQVLNKKPEIAVVTKISDNMNTIENDKNINNIVNSQILAGLNDNDIDNPILNKTAELPKNQNININFIQNNINNINIKNPNQTIQKQQQIPTNNYILDDIDKLLNQNYNQYLGQKEQKNLVVNKPLYPPQQNSKYRSNYNTGTNTVITSHNFNQKGINIYQNQLQPKDNYNQYYQSQSERATLAKDIISNSKNPMDNKKDVDVTYNDFDGSGYVKNYGGVSKPGRDSSGENKTNQDALVCITNINNIKDFNIFGVLDGHGPDGHFVSQFAADFIPSNIFNHPEIKSLKEPERIYQKLKENNCNIITQAFIMADNKLKNVDFDVFESGSTCCLIIHIGTHIICANTGDSRALVVFDNPGNTNINNVDYWNAVPLSLDYKPELPEERNRILMSGGVVEQMKGDFGQRCGPFRVWIRGKDYPGLAMSRSIGDLKGKEVGVIPNPGILEYDLNKSTRFVIACSDGVFEFLENKTVMDIGKFFYLKNDASAFCHELVSRALNEWTANDNIVDDITAVVAFF